MNRQDPFDTTIESAYREFVREHGEECAYPVWGKKYTWEPAVENTYAGYGGNRPVVRAQVAVSMTTDAVEVSVWYIQEGREVHNPVVFITDDGRKIRQHGETNMVNWAAEIGLE